jgi:hypothetical protein
MKWMSHPCRTEWPAEDRDRCDPDRCALRMARAEAGGQATFLTQAVG